MKIKELVSHIAKQEGKKHEASIGDVREIIGILSDIFCYESYVLSIQTYNELVKNGRRREKKASKK